MATKSKVKRRNVVVELKSMSGADLPTGQPRRRRSREPYVGDKFTRWFKAKALLLPSKDGGWGVRVPVECFIEAANEGVPSVKFRVTHGGREYEGASIADLRQKISLGNDMTAGRKWYAFIQLPYSVDDLTRLRTENDLRLVLIDRPTVRAATAPETMHRDGRFDKAAEDGGVRKFDLVPRKLNQCVCGNGGFVPDTKAWRLWLLKTAAKHRAVVESLQTEWKSVVSTATGDRALRWFDTVNV